MNQTESYSLVEEAAFVQDLFRYSLKTLDEQRCLANSICLFPALVGSANWVNPYENSQRRGDSMINQLRCLRAFKSRNARTHQIL